MEPLRAIAARTLASRLMICVLGAACCLLPAGCRNGRQMQADLYQRELRLQEDEIYRLEDYVEEYQSIISSYRCEIAELKRELAATPAKPTSARSRAIDPASERDTAPPADDDASLLITPKPTDFNQPSAEPLPPGHERPPVGDEAPAFRPSDANPVETDSIETDSLESDSLKSQPLKTKPLETESLETAPPFKGAAIERGRAVPIAAAPREPALLQPISATLSAAPSPNDAPPNPYPNATPKRTVAVEPLPESIGDPSIRLSAEVADDSAPSMVVIVEPVEADALRRFSGAVSIMLTDPADDGRSKRIARWDFDEVEVRAAMSSDPRGLRLTISLPAETPTDRPLRLWARMMDRGGLRKLQATDVRFLANPLRLIENESIAEANTLHRLPTPGASGRQDNAVVQSPSGGWRASQPGATERRIDPAVAPASYEAW